MGVPTSADFSKGEILCGSYRVLLRRDFTSCWTTNNPVLRLGELGFDLNVKWFKLGDGKTPWNDLPWAEGPSPWPFNDKSIPITETAVAFSDIDEWIDKFRSFPPDSVRVPVEELHRIFLAYLMSICLHRLVWP